MSFSSLSLSALQPGEQARVLRVEGDDAVSERLRDLGFWPGTPVTLVRRAPWGDPGEYHLRGFRLALRRQEAGKVIVEREAATP